MKNLRYREFKKLVQNHIGSKGQSWDSHPDSLAPESVP